MQPNQNKTSAQTPPLAVSLRLETLKNRPDFLAAARAQKWGTKGFLLQARNRNDNSATIRVGYTCSKKLGNAVARNRAKRRLRAIAQRLLPQLGQPGYDYVLIGKPEATIDRDFQDLLTDLSYAIDKIHT